MTGLWLVGVMGTGKTTAGRLAASDLGVPFWDTDELVEAEAGALLAEIWDREGEEGFRRREKAVIAGLAEAEGVIATGGGAVLDPDNRSAMSGGVVVWLTATPETVAGRVSAEGRPLLAGAPVARTIEALLAERTDLYEQVAGHVVETDGLDLREVAGRIARLWPK